MDIPATDAEAKPMDIPATDAEVKPEMLEEVKEAGPSFHCNLVDMEIVYKIAQVLLPGLASACVDNTTGGLFNTPASVAVDMRKEMVDHLIQRSESFVAESVILEDGPEAEVSDHPYDIISDFVDDFVVSKRNFFSRVSGWLLSDRREDKIDDFVQEMEINGFWLLDRRETIAQTLLRNVDFKDLFHCNMKFNSAEELPAHALQCNFRTIDCTNEGCNARFCAAHLENHDSTCPFKILPCDQKCPDSIMRREMDRHCITVCPMKLVSCPFYSVGCQSTFPQTKIEEHRLENLHSHMIYILQIAHKEASVEDLKERVEQLEKASSPGQLKRGRDVRSLTFVIKDLEAKVGPLIIKKVSEESPESTTKMEGSIESPTKTKECPESMTETRKGATSPTKKPESLESPSKNESCPATEKEESTKLPPGNEESSTNSPAVKEEPSTGPPRKEEPITKLPAGKEEPGTKSPPGKEKPTTVSLPRDEESSTRSPPTNEDSGTMSPSRQAEVSTKMPPGNEESSTKLPLGIEESSQSSSKERESMVPTTKKQGSSGFPIIQENA